VKLETEYETGHAENRLRRVRIRQRAIGMLFRHHWNDIAREPLPEDMQVLLGQLRGLSKRDRRTGKEAAKGRGL
jgi:hypothetical protein